MNEINKVLELIGNDIKYNNKSLIRTMDELEQDKYYVLVFNNTDDLDFNNLESANTIRMFKYCDCDQVVLNRQTGWSFIPECNDSLVDNYIYLANNVNYHELTPETYKRIKSGEIIKIMGYVEYLDFCRENDTLY